MNQTEAPSKIKSAAPGQYLGYSLQQLRFCYHLLHAKPGDHVSFELLDDVAVHYSSGQLLLEQCKSATSANAVADRAVDLWKTFANWAELSTTAKIEPANTRFRLYVTPTGNPGIAEELNGAKTPVAAKAVITKIKKLLKKGRQAAAVDDHIQRFLAAGEGVNEIIIRNFELIVDNEPNESVQSFFHVLVSVKALEDIAAAAVGMARDRIDNLIKKQQPPIIDASTFQSIVRAFVRKNNLTNLLISKASEPSAQAISDHLNASPVFVQQLQLVKASPDLLTTAISDWLKATADKIYWADEGTVFAGSFTEFDAALVRRHKLVRDEVEDNHSGKTAEYRGREVYRRCTASNIPLEGNSVPDHFVSGSYNCLADTNKIGWHPDHESLFPLDSAG